jgi:hypothetical protein
VSLSLVVGPAHSRQESGRSSTGFVAALDRDPWLIVPQRADVERVERELLGRQGALLAGTIGTFDTLFEQLARGRGGSPPRGDAERQAFSSDGLAARGGTEAARFAGFADASAARWQRLDGALLEPTDSRRAPRARSRRTARSWSASTAGTAAGLPPGRRGG